MGINKLKEILNIKKKISEDPITQATHNSEKKYAIGIDVSDILPIFEELYGEDIDEKLTKVGKELRSEMKKTSYLAKIASELPHLDNENLVRYAKKGIIYCTIDGSFGEVEQKVQDIKQTLFEKHPYANIGIVALRPNKKDKTPASLYNNRQSCMYQKLEFMLESAKRDNLAEVKKL